MALGESCPENFGGGAGNIIPRVWLQRFFITLNEKGNFMHTLDYCSFPHEILWVRDGYRIWVITDGSSFSFHLPPRIKVGKGSSEETRYDELFFSTN
jgi:hypothetical protein